MSFGPENMTVMEECSVLGKANEPPFPRPQKQSTEEPVYYQASANNYRVLGATTPPHTRTHTHTHTHTQAHFESF